MNWLANYSEFLSQFARAYIIFLHSSLELHTKPHVVCCALFAHCCCFVLLFACFSNETHDQAHCVCICGTVYERVCVSARRIYLRAPFCVTYFMTHESRSNSSVYFTTIYDLLTGFSCGSRHHSPKQAGKQIKFVKFVLIRYDVDARIAPTTATTPKADFTWNRERI